jgi:hypothetical protein
VSLNYELLGEAQAEHLRKQRLLDLEADHFRFVLDAEEVPPGEDAGPIMAKLADVERRIALHRQALGLSVDVLKIDGEDTLERSDAESS